MKEMFYYSRVDYKKKSREPFSAANFEAANAKKLGHATSVVFLVL